VSRGKSHVGFKKCIGKSFSVVFGFQKSKLESIFQKFKFLESKKSWGKNGVFFEIYVKNDPRFQNVTF
jgi:hypothetical protein